MPAGPSTTLKGEFASTLHKAAKAAYPNADLSESVVLGTVEEARVEDADLSSSLCFRLAKQLKENPNKIAEAVAANSKPSKPLKGIAAAGGYINATIDVPAYSKLVIDGILKSGGKYGSGDMGNGEKVLVESPAVNPNKPWHIGQLRNALLGNVISNVYERCGYSVEREDYIDDLGLQIAESLWGYMNLANKPDKKVDQWFGEQYVAVNKVMAQRDLKPELNALLSKMESQAGKEAETAKEIAEMCLRAQYATGFDYGICHDVMIWESSIVKARLLDKAIKLAEEKHILTKPASGKFAGCLVVDLSKGDSKEFEGNEETVKVLVRSNGVATYIAKDFAFHMWKFGMLDAGFKYSKFMERQPNKKPLFTTSDAGEQMPFGKAKRAINLIGSEQKYEQSVLKTLFALMGRNDIADNIIHLAYGLVSVESGSLSGRTGGWIGEGRNYTADDLLREVKEKAKEIVMQSEKIEDKSNADEIAKAVALAAIKFEYLRVTPEKEVIFSWKKALDFESNSGPYCMYTYARANRILQKGEVKAVSLEDSDYKNITRGADLALLKLLGAAQEVTEKACNEYRPSILTGYLLDISSLFSKFYETMPVLKGGKAKDARLALVLATKQVVWNMLALIGITPVESM